MLGEHCGLVLEFPGVVGSIVETASDPWLSTVVPESPDVDLGPTLAALVRAPVSVFTCGARQANEATAAGFTEVVARQPAMGLGFPVEGEAPAEVEDRVVLAGVGAVAHLDKPFERRELERALAAALAAEAA